MVMGRRRDYDNSWPRQRVSHHEETWTDLCMDEYGGPVSPIADT